MPPVQKSIELHRSQLVLPAEPRAQDSRIAGRETNRPPGARSPVVQWCRLRRFQPDSASVAQPQGLTWEHDEGPTPLTTSRHSSTASPRTARKESAYPQSPRCPHEQGADRGAPSPGAAERTVTCPRPLQVLPGVPASRSPPAECRSSHPRHPPIPAAPPTWDHDEAGNYPPPSAETRWRSSRRSRAGRSRTCRCPC